jgi:hypothetical protein
MQEVVEALFVVGLVEPNGECCIVDNGLGEAEGPGIVLPIGRDSEENAGGTAGLADLLDLGNHVAELVAALGLPPPSNGEAVVDHLQNVLGLWPRGIFLGKSELGLEVLIIDKVSCLLENVMHRNHL